MSTAFVIIGFILIFAGIISYGIMFNTSKNQYKTNKMSLMLK